MMSPEEATLKKTKAPETPQKQQEVIPTIESPLKRPRSFSMPSAKENALHSIIFWSLFTLCLSFSWQIYLFINEKQSGPMKQAEETI